MDTSNFIKMVMDMTAEMGRLHHMEPNVFVVDQDGPRIYIGQENGSR